MEHGHLVICEAHSGGALDVDVEVQELSRAFILRAVSADSKHEAVRVESTLYRRSLSKGV